MAEPMTDMELQDLMAELSFLRGRYDSDNRFCDEEKAEMQKAFHLKAAEQADQINTLRRLLSEMEDRNLTMRARIDAILGYE